MPVRVLTSRAAELARFSLLRVARGMPSLRPFRPIPVRLADRFQVTLPDSDAIAPQNRAVIFDGGIPPDVDLSRWVDLVEPEGLSKAVPAYQEHGLGVT